MRAVIQRVSRASVSVASNKVAEIHCGLLVLMGISIRDSLIDADYMAGKIPQLRIFPDEQGKMNLSLAEAGGHLLVVPNFTLYGDCTKGRRPAFDRAARAEQALPIYEYFLQVLRQSAIPVSSGVFGAHMEVALVNDGPVTFLVESGNGAEPI